MIPCVCAVAFAVAARAQAADQFTLDAHPDSIAPVVTDAAGNGYVAWEDAGSGGAADTPMFCKLPLGAKRCAHPVALQLPDAGAGGEADADAPFPILGPGNVIWVVTDRYVMGDTLIWTSDNGGQTFGSPHVIPAGTVCPQPGQPCGDSVPNPDQTSLDDVAPEGPNSEAPYDRQTYVNDGVPYVNWVEASHNPGLGYAWNGTDVAYDFGGGVFEFTFPNPGSGGVLDATIGTTSSGDVVEAYALGSAPYTLAYYRFTPGPNSQRSYLGGPSTWVGPDLLGDGYLPRIADGAAGLFLLSSDAPAAAGDPLAVRVRKYDGASHAFGSPVTVVVNPASQAGSYLYKGGGLGENINTGELVAAWPQLSATGDLMRAYISTDGGARFAPAEDVATIGSSYSNFENARVAVAPNGSGWVTFTDAGGIEVANLYPIGAQYKILGSAGGGQVVKVPFICPAPSGSCRVTALLTGGTVLAQDTFKLPAGASRSLKLHLNRAGLKLLTGARGTRRARLTLMVRLPGGATTKLAYKTEFRYRR